MKYANLIFAEHSKLTIENDLLKEQISDLNNTLSISEEIIHNRGLIIDQYKDLNTAYERKVQDLNKEIKRKNKTILGLSIGGATVSVGLLLFMLLK